MRVPDQERERERARAKWRKIQNFSSMPSREEAAPRGSNLLVKRQRLRDRQETDRGWVGMEEVQNFSIKGHHPKRRQVLGSQTYWSNREMRALDQERGTEGRAGRVRDGGPRLSDKGRQAHRGQVHRGLQPIGLNER